MQALADKILVLGIDGMDPRVTQKYLAEGKMPSLQKFVDLGAQREDLSMLGAHPTLTPPMWTTMATGAYPITHGITCFNRQSKDHFGQIGYNFDSRNCLAEPLWNVFAEAGKKTLVWHWPGSSWPPTSDNPNLYVVDGTQPAAVNNFATVDTEFILLADEKIDQILIKERAATDTNIPCVVNDLETSQYELDTSLGDSCHVLLTEEDGEGIVSVMPFDLALSPIKPAAGWTQAPDGAKEFTLLFSSGLLRRLGLVLQNDQGVYDRVALYHSKKDAEPYAILRNNVFEQNIIDEAIKNDLHYEVNRNMRLIELAEDGSHVKIWVSPAMNIHDDSHFHPNTLFHDIIEHVGYPQPFSFLGGSDKVLINDCTGANWGVTAKWTADCLNYLIAEKDMEVIFSHFHNIDLQGHMIVKYLKDKNLPGAKLTEAEYQQLFENVYLQTDAYIGEFLHLLDKGWTVLIVSDHGQVCPEYSHELLGDPTGINVPIMRELGFTAIKQDSDGNDLHEIDWANTRAIAVRANHIYVNLKGRDENGIVDPADKYDLEEEIITALYGYKNKETGKRIIALALRNKDAVLMGMGGPECGDILYYTSEGYTMDHGDCISTVEGYADTSVAPIFIAAGPGLKKGYRTTRIIREVDLAPTIAVLGGVRMPNECEGAPVYQIFDWPQA